MQTYLITCSLYIEPDMYKYNFKTIILILHLQLGLPGTGLMKSYTGQIDHMTKLRCMSHPQVIEPSSTALKTA